MTPHGYGGAPAAPQIYRIKKQLFTLLDQKFRFYDDAGNLMYFCRQKAFKLKEDIRIYADEAQTREVLCIRARQIIDFSAYYDVYDSTTQTRVGAMHRLGLKSLLRDKWEILDPYDRPIGFIEEDSLGLALVRRVLLSLIPQNFTITVHNQPVGSLHQHFNPFLLTYTLDLTADPNGWLDRRLAVGASILLLAIEGRQKETF